MLLRTDEYCEQLFLREKEVFAEDGEIFDLLSSDAVDIPLSEIPVGIKVQLCDRVFGLPHELTTRPPHVIFENSTDCGLLAHLSIPFFPPTDHSTGEVLRDYFVQAIETGECSLEPLKDAGRIVSLDSSIDDDHAFLNCAIIMHDQTMAEAELFVAQIAMLRGGGSPRGYLHYSVPLQQEKRATLDVSQYAWQDSNLRPTD